MGQGVSQLTCRLNGSHEKIWNPSSLLHAKHVASWLKPKSSNSLARGLSIETVDGIRVENLVRSNQPFIEGDVTVHVPKTLFYTQKLEGGF